MVQFCFAMEIREWGRLISGNKGEPRGMKGREQLLTSCDISSLVIDSLCDQAREQNAAVACFTSTSQPKRSSHRRACWEPCLSKLLAD